MREQRRERALVEPQLGVRQVVVVEQQQVGLALAPGSGRLAAAGAGVGIGLLTSRQAGRALADAVVASAGCAALSSAVFEIAVPDLAILQRSLPEGALRLVAAADESGGVALHDGTGLEWRRAADPLSREPADLGERLETRKAVERAKGVLMKKLKISEAEAFRWIQKTAMDRRLGMREVADAVVAGMDKA